MINGCVTILITIAILSNKQGSAAKWENGRPPKWARRLEDEVLGTWSSKGESKERDWKFEEARGETFWLWVRGVVLAVLLSSELSFLFLAVYRVTWQVTLGCDVCMNINLWPILRKHILWHIAFQTARKGPNRILKNRLKLIIWIFCDESNCLPRHVLVIITSHEVKNLWHFLSYVAHVQSSKHTILWRFLVLIMMKMSVTN